MSALGDGTRGGPSAWCPACGTAHDDPRLCPGELPATGAERPGRRMSVETPRGREATGVMLAPCRDAWRARIVTYPNVLWTIPGGRATIKFVGATREEAERSAIAFIEQHVRARGLPRRDVPVLAPPPAARPAAAPKTLWAKERRKTVALPVRYGIERPIARGVTLNVSADGMFVGAPRPEESGRVLFINLEFRGHTLPLRGLVMWSRSRTESAGPTGMGIRLTDPPPFYRSVVAAIP